MQYINIVHRNYCLGLGFNRNRHEIKNVIYTIKRLRKFVRPLQANVFNFPSLQINIWILGFWRLGLMSCMEPYYVFVLYSSCSGGYCNTGVLRGSRNVLKMYMFL